MQYMAMTAARWSSPRRLLWLLVANTLLWLVFGNAIVWGPLWSHWRVAPPAVDAAVIESHRLQPADSVLAVVAETSMTTDHPLRGEAAVAAAREILRGRVVLPDLPVLEIDPGFSPADLALGVPSQQVFNASLIVPDLLLRAHEHAPDPAFPAAALRYARAFIEYEARAQMPRDFLRNAHAVANRASVLARLWKHARQSPGYVVEDGRLIHLHAQRLGALLAKPATFIASTNHGVMQNIGLLQLATAFPALPDAARWRQLALHRLQLQQGGWIAPDGAVLEHSSGYHFHGVVLSGYVVKLQQAAGETPPAAWVEAHRRALGHLHTLQRPDGSLPSHGNTFRYAWRLPPVLEEGADRAAAARAGASFARVLPVSGNAVWSSVDSAAGVPTHTHIPWGYFSTHGHRRAQEMSLLVWADGTDWSSNTGYWPAEDSAGVAIVAGWEGGNGPHLVGESAAQERHTLLLASHDDGRLRFLDLERSTADQSGAARMRRQVLQWRGSTWLVLDTYSDPLNRPLQVLWTTAPETSQRPMAGQVFHYTRAGSRVAMLLGIQGSDGVSATPRRGSLAPFGGWVAFDRKAAAAPAIDARLHSVQDWMLTTLSLVPDAEAQGNKEGTVPTMVRYADPTRWTIKLGGASQQESVELARDAATLTVRTSSSPGTATQPVTVLSLAAGENPQTALRAIADSRAILLAEFPRYRTQEWERRRLSLALWVAWAGSSIALVALWVFIRRRRA
jgi:hypothetical protein